MKIKIDRIKAEHTCYKNIERTSVSNFSFVKKNDYDAVIIALEDPTSEQRVVHYMGSGKMVYTYCEHIGSLTGDINQNYIYQLIHSPNFKGFISHSLDTVNQLKSLFKTWPYIKPQPNILESSVNACDKVFYLPVGVPSQDQSLIVNKIASLYNREITFLFWSSWNDVNLNNFSGRGGNYADEIFCNIRKEIPCSLIIRSNRPLKSENLYPGSVTRIDKYMSEEEKHNVFLKSDIFLLPALQAHFISIPEAASYGMPCIGTNYWGFAENVIDDFNGIIESNITNDVSNKHVNYDYVNRVSERLLRLIKNKDKLIEMSFNSLFFQKKNHSFENYNNFFCNQFGR